MSIRGSETGNQSDTNELTDTNCVEDVEDCILIHSQYACPENNEGNECQKPNGITLAAGTRQCLTQTLE